MRARTLTASASSLSPAEGRWLWRSVADQVGQDFGVPGIGLGARDGVAVAVAAGGQRVDRIYLIAGRDQRAHEQAAVGLGPDHDLGRVGDQAGQQLMQDGQPGQPLSHPRRRMTTE